MVEPSSHLALYAAKAQFTRSFGHLCATLVSFTDFMKRV